MRIEISSQHPQTHTDRVNKPFFKPTSSSECTLRLSTSFVLKPGAFWEIWWFCFSPCIPEKLICGKEGRHLERMMCVVEPLVWSLRILCTSEALNALIVF